MPKRKPGTTRDFTDRARAVSDLRRISENTRTPKKTILIVCEGEKTEPLYLNGLKQEYRHSAIQVKIIGSGSSPITVVDETLSIQYG